MSPREKRRSNASSRKNSMDRYMNDTKGKEEVKPDQQQQQPDKIE